ncbi:hypothetical protein ACHWQZ_G012346 [Mnemiopsis leidyi]
MALLKLLIFATVSYLGYHYSSTLFENDRFFSHLSTLEREMTFRTEAGFYYMFYKTIVEAPSFLEGWDLLVNDSGTEYPSHINTLQRFNVYPEVVLGGMFRVFRSVLTSLDMVDSFVQCYGIDRGNDLPRVQSCVGAGELSIFYVNCIFILTGLHVGFLFLMGCHLSDNILGGILAVSAVFFNYGECSRVQWIPPLRESFSCPFILLQMMIVSIMLKSGSSKVKQVSLVLATVCAALPWQFSQFVLFTQTVSLFGSYSLSFLTKHQVSPVLDSIFLGFVIATVCQFLNTMLISSMYVSAYLAFKVVILTNNHVKLSNRILQFSKDAVVFLLVAASYKAGSAWILELSDDAHIFNILRSKFTDYKDFHTLLYTCSKAFDFIEVDVFGSLSLTLLLPTTVAVLARIFFVFGRAAIQGAAPPIPVPEVHPLEENGKKKKGKQASEEKTSDQSGSKEESVSEHSYLTYLVFQFVCYLGMAVIIMRLKLFMTPHMCLLASLVANNFVLPQNEKSRYVIVFLLLGAMSIFGYSNIQDQLSRQGEFNNPQQEKLFDWISRKTAPQAVFAGPMPLTANLRLSTGRYIVNHPHYEDAGMRDRTYLVYQLFSRAPGERVHNSLKSLGVQYAVLDKYWCMKNRPKTGCAIPELWDFVDPENSGKNTFCEEVSSYRHLFDLAYSNPQYRVLKVK